MSVAHEFLMLWLVPGGVKGKREKRSQRLDRTKE
jgi:hypothetical protein